MSEVTAEAPGSVFIVGTGRLGLSLGRALHHGGRLAGMAWHTKAGRERAQRWLPQTTLWPLRVPEGLGAAATVVLAVRDDAIAEAATALIPFRRPGQVVLHTSGLRTSQTLRDAGLSAPVGSFHPLQTFADPELGPELLARCVAACEGDSEAVAAAFGLARSVGAEPIELAADAKVAYHAAAVVASNYLVVITGLAARLAAEAGIEEGRAIRMLAPLQRGALDNLGELGVATALTGPIARGDVDTVRAHLNVIEAACPDLRDAYVVLGRHAVDLARMRGVDEGRLAEIEMQLGREVTSG